mmetsp:Transcript_10078/g.46190  ORF Transcript_10078/g.46190 Transcript_10078/m.46190 type:complete len:378 (+) Transcript_10078:113-1246(+)
MCSTAASNAAASDCVRNPPKIIAPFDLGADELGLELELLAVDELVGHHALLRALQEAAVVLAGRVRVAVLGTRGHPRLGDPLLLRAIGSEDVVHAGAAHVVVHPAAHHVVTHVVLVEPVVVAGLAELLGHGEGDVEALFEGDVLHAVHGGVEGVPDRGVKGDGADDDGGDRGGAEAHEREDGYGGGEHLHGHQAGDVVLERGAAVLGFDEHLGGLRLQPLGVGLEGHVVEGLGVVLDVAAAVGLGRHLGSGHLAPERLHPVGLVELGVLEPAVGDVLVEGDHRVHGGHGEGPAGGDDHGGLGAGHGDHIGGAAASGGGAHLAEGLGLGHGDADERLTHGGGGSEGHLICMVCARSEPERACCVSTSATVAHEGGRRS